MDLRLISRGMLVDYDWWVRPTSPLSAARVPPSASGYHRSTCVPVDSLLCKPDASCLSSSHVATGLSRKDIQPQAASASSANCRSGFRRPSRLKARPISSCHADSTGAHTRSSSCTRICTCNPSERRYQIERAGLELR